jgi:replicative DNA helicase
MDAKLTLKLNQEVIEKAKKYASDQKMSLSRIVETYLQSLTTQKETGDKLRISTFVKSISSGTKIPADLDYKEEYSEYLLEKYK